MTDLGARDLAAVLAFANDRKGKGEVCFIGHSFGMIAFALAPNAGLASRAISIGSGHYQLQAFPRGPAPPVLLGGLRFPCRAPARLLPRPHARVHRGSAANGRRTRTSPAAVEHGSSWRMR